MDFGFLVFDADPRQCNAHDYSRAWSDDNPQLDPVRPRASAGSETPASRLMALVPIVVVNLALGIAQAGALDETQSGAVATMVKAYPDFLDRIDGNDVVWKDGTRQRIDDGKAAKSFEAMLDDPDIKDMSR